jgi:hypothetical protein
MAAPLPPDPADDLAARLARFFRRLADFFSDIRTAAREARNGAGPRLAAATADDAAPLSAELERTSHVLRRISREAPESYVTVDWLADNLKGRGFGLLLLFLALFNMLPFASAFGGLVTCFPAVSMILGRKRVWLPFIGARPIKASYVRLALDQSIPHVERFEKYIRPRLAFLTDPPFENLHGLFVLVMALILILPIAGANFMPALAIALISLGYLERDGLTIILGWLTGLAFIAIAFVALFLANSVWDWLFG